MLQIEDIEDIGDIGKKLSTLGAWQALSEHCVNVPCLARAYNYPPIRRLGIEKIGALHPCNAHVMRVTGLGCILLSRKLFPIKG